MSGQAHHRTRPRATTAAVFTTIAVLAVTAACGRIGFGLVEPGEDGGPPSAPLADGAVPGDANAGVAGADGSAGDAIGSPTAACPSRCACESHQGRHYAFCSLAGGESLTWQASRAACTSAGLELARIDAQAELDWVLGRLTGQATQVWLGGNSRTQDDVWRWPNGDILWTGDQGGAPSPGTIPLWKPGDPNDRSRREACMELSIAEGGWNDQDCEDRRGFLCERSEDLPPPSLGAITVEGNSATITWLPLAAPTGVSGYQIIYGYSNTGSRVVPAAAHSVILNDLQEGPTVVSLQAMGAGGPGAHSETATFYVGNRIADVTAPDSHGFWMSVTASATEIQNGRTVYRANNVLEVAIEAMAMDALLDANRLIEDEVGLRVTYLDNGNEPIRVAAGVSPDFATLARNDTGGFVTNVVPLRGANMALPLHPSFILRAPQGNAGRLYVASIELVRLP